MWNGYFWLFVNASGSTHVNDFEQVYVNGALLITRYLLPSTDATVSVGNGPGASTTATLVFSVPSYLAPFGPAGFDVELLNASGSNHVIASGLSGNNGSAVFTHVNTAYNYIALTDGYNTTQNGLAHYGPSNNSGGTITGPTGVKTGSSGTFVPPNSHTATITGSALPTGGQDWDVSTDANVTGGVIHIGSQLYASKNAYVRFKNTTVFFNTTSQDWGTHVGFSFSNCTVIYLTETDQLSGSRFLYANNSFFALSAFAGGQGQYESFKSTSFSHSIVTGDAANVSGQPSTSLLGTFTNTEFVNLSIAPPQSPAGWLGVNLLSDSILNSSIGAFGSGLWVNHTFLWNSSIFDYPGITVYSAIYQSNFEYAVLRATNENITDSRVLLTAYNAIKPPGGAGGIDWHTAISDGATASFDNDSFGFAAPLSVPYATFHVAIQTNLTLYITNITSSILNFTQLPRTELTISSYELRLYNDYVTTNYSLTQLLQIVSSGNTSAGNHIAIFPVLQISAGFELAINFTTLDGSGNTILTAGTCYAWYSHDLWPWYAVGNIWAMFGMFQAIESPLRHINFDNDTFARVFINATYLVDFEKALEPGSGGPLGIQWMFDTNFKKQANPVGILTVNDTTFDSVPVGPGAQFFSGGILQGTNGVKAYFSGDVFLNSQKYQSGAVAYNNGTLWVAPYAEDIIAVGGTSYITNDWFLNLSNSTAPVGENGGSQTSGSNPAVTMSGNHFYYAPTTLEGGFVDPMGPTRTTQASTPDDWFTSLKTTSTLTYEVPMNTNATLSFTAGGGQLVSNSSGTQTSASFQGPGSYNSATNYAWIVTPDVNTSTGMATVSYAGDGGPQPNFYWSGYNYSESVEPTYVELGANSTRAPTIGILFSNLRPNAVYSVAWYTPAGSYIGAASVVSTVNGTVTWEDNQSGTPGPTVFEILAGNQPPNPSGSIGGLATLTIVGAIGITIAAVLTRWGRR